MSVFRSIAQNLIFLKSCRACGSFQRDCGFLCGTCWRGAELFVWQKGLLELPQVPGLLIRPLFQWNPGESDHLSELILAHKGSYHQGEWRWAAEQWLAKQNLLEAVHQNDRTGSTTPKDLMFIPAPSSTGGQHAHEFAQAFASYLGGQVKDMLRMKSTIKQRGLSRLERALRSIEMVEQFTAETRERSLIVLVDDVLTTGQTAEACRRALGIPQLEVWCLAYRSRLAASS